MNTVASRAEWFAARMDLLAREKEFTKVRDDLSRARRALPWVKVENAYVFDGPDGEETLAQLFGARSQLIVYHFMYDPDWEQGCKSCSFWADNFNGIDIHLAHRDTALVMVSKAPLETLQAFRKRMGWTMKWVSSFRNDFNRDYRVSFTAEEKAQNKAYYNFREGKYYASEMPGLSVFFKGEAGQVFHTYSTYARGLDMLNGAYHLLDLTPKGRNEDGLPGTMAWLRHRDRYED